jgi:hypothetical protein
MPRAKVRFVAFSGSPQATRGVDVTQSFDAGVRLLVCHAVYLANLGGEMASPDTFLRGGAEQPAAGWVSCSPQHSN